MMSAIIAAFEAMSVAEVIAVILGVVYLVLAVKRSRWCWVAGGISSAIVIWLSAQRGLPMQAALNVYYVIVSVYGSGAGPIPRHRSRLFRCCRCAGMCWARQASWW